MSFKGGFIAATKSSKNYKKNAEKVDHPASEKKTSNSAPSPRRRNIGQDSGCRTSRNRKSASN